MASWSARQRRGVDTKRIGQGVAARLEAVPLANQATQNLVSAYRWYRAKFTSGYMGDKRRKLVERFGYDAKNAAHAVRLLRMAVGFLGTGILEVYRERDGDELRAIKKGEWTLAQVKAEAERLFAEAEAAYVASPLPESVDIERINRLLVDLTLRHWRATSET